MSDSTLDTPGAGAAFDSQEARYRLVVEQFLAPDDCARLVAFADEHGIVGDGYRGNPHPHTPYETFAGYSFDGRKGDPSLPGHMLALQVMQRARRLLKKHFGLPFLWLDFGHLVIREPTGTDPAAETGPTEAMSHPWHFDNQHATIRHRSHTAILYLNDDFEGGLTRFRAADFGPEREVRPEAGKLVAFSVAENAHAVSKLRSGRRYVLNMWFSTHWSKWPNHRRIFRPL